MRGEGEIADARAVGQDHRHRRRLPAASAPRFEDVAHGAGAQGVPLQREGHGGREFLRAIVLEQGEQPDEMRPERVAALG
jgi:hypothetical protein